MEEIALKIVLLQTDDYPRINEEMREALKSILLKVVTGRVKFTAYGLYEINLCSLSSILTGILSYLVMAIQFYAE